MELEDERQLIHALLDGELLHVDCAGVVVAGNSGGTSTVLLSMASDDGRRYFVPLGRDLALLLGEQMVRAVDAIDGGLILTPQPGDEAGGGDAATPAR